VKPLHGVVAVVSVDVSHLVRGHWPDGPDGSPLVEAYVCPACVADHASARMSDSGPWEVGLGYLFTNYLRMNLQTRLVCQFAFYVLYLLFDLVIYVC